MARHRIRIITGSAYFFQRVSVFILTISVAKQFFFGRVDNLKPQIFLSDFLVCLFGKYVIIRPTQTKHSKTFVKSLIFPKYLGIVLLQLYICREDKINKFLKTAMMKLTSQNIVEISLLWCWKDIQIH